MSVNETEGMIKVRVAWMRGGWVCVWIVCMRARMCVWCMRACVSQPDIHLPHTLLAALSYSSPPHPLLHTSTPPPLRLSTFRTTIKVLAHGETDRILGIHIIGANAGELIAEGVLAMEYVLRHMSYGLRVSVIRLSLYPSLCPTLGLGFC